MLDSRAVSNDARKLFDRYDKDKSGSIEVRELEALFRALGTKFGEDQLLSAMAALKTARPNRVTWDEFQQMWAELRSPSRSAPPAQSREAESAPVKSRPQPLDLQAVFRRFDRDGSGSIDVGELAGMLEALGMEPDDDELDAAIERLDTDESGRISWDEFRAWWDEHGD